MLAVLAGTGLLAVSCTDCVSSPVSITVDASRSALLVVVRSGAWQAVSV